MFPLLLLSSVVYSQIQLPAGHPDVQQALAAGTKPPTGHPLVNGMLGLGGGHPNVDQMMQQGTKLPGGHPNIANRFTYAQAPATSPASSPVVAAAPKITTTTTTTRPAVPTTTQPKPAATPLTPAGTGSYGASGPTAGGYTAKPPPPVIDDCDDGPIAPVPTTTPAPVLTTTAAYPTQAAPAATQTYPTYSSAKGLEIGLAWLAVLLW